jgi:hypothetical protein
MGLSAAGRAAAQSFDNTAADYDRLGDLSDALDPGSIGRRGSSRAVPMAAAGMYEDVRPLRFMLAGARASQAVVAARIGLRVPDQVRGGLRAGRGRRSGQGRRIGRVNIGPEAPG